MKVSSRENRPSHHPDMGLPKETQWAWLTKLMYGNVGSALWASYLPTRPGRRRPTPAAYRPAITPRRAKGVNWGKLTDILSLHLNNEGRRQAQVLVILSDNRSPDTIQHWEFLDPSGKIQVCQLGATLLHLDPCDSGGRSGWQALHVDYCCCGQSTHVQPRLRWQTPPIPGP